jgi:GAF domain-containing protein
MAAAGGSQSRYTLQTGEPVVMDDARVEARFDVWPPGIASAATVLITDHERRFGVLKAASVPRRRFDRDEITFLQSVANLLAAALARFHAEDQVRHQALHDTLTGLPNRTLFLDRLSRARDGRTPRWRCCSPTSMASSTSMTPWAITPATRSSSRWPRG